MGGQAEDIYAILFHIYRQVSCGLGGIHAEKYAVAAAKFSDLANGEGIGTDI